MNRSQRLSGSDRRTTLSYKVLRETKGRDRSFTRAAGRPEVSPRVSELPIPRRHRPPGAAESSPSDVPVFSIPNQFGGQTFAVYDPTSDKEFDQVFELNRQGRVDAFGPANYRPRQQAARWIETAVLRAAKRMVDDVPSAHSERISTRVGMAPKHIEATN